MVSLIVVVNGVSSPQRLVDIAKVVYGSEVSEMVKAFVVTRVGGNVAQVGLPEVGKLAYKLNRPLLILPTIGDAVELLNPTEVLLVQQSAESQYIEDMQLGSSPMLVFSGGDSGFSRNELLLGKQVYFKGFNKGVSPVAEVAITLYVLALRYGKR